VRMIDCIANGNPKKQLRVGGSIRNTANHSHFGRARTLAVTNGN
jgi:hypothetical protein